MSLKKGLSVLLALSITLLMLPTGNMISFAASSVCYSNFYDAAYDSDPGQYMVNIAFAQEGRTGADLDYSADWCAWFIADCARKAGQIEAFSSARGRVDYFIDDIISAGGYEVPVSEAKAGDVVYVDWPNSGYEWDHVEMVVNSYGNTVNTIGGNSGATSATTNKYRYRKVVNHDPLSGYNKIKIYRPNYTNSAPVSAPTASTDHKHYYVGENASFSFSADGASSLHLYIYLNGNKYFEGEFNPSATYSRYISTVGHYAYYIVAHYPGGNVESAWNDFDVVQNPPSVCTDKKQYSVGQNAAFSFSVDGASSLHLYIYLDGNKYFEGEFSPSATYSRYLSTTGHYAYYIVAHYSDRNIESAWNDFDVIQNTYVVQFNGNGATSGSMSNQTFTYDVAQNLTANAFKRAYTVTYNYNGATGGNSASSATATATFNGWATSAIGAKVYNDKQSVSNLTTSGTFNLYAKWTLGTITLPTPAKTGYSFDGWFTDPELTNAVGSLFTPDKDCTLYAKWEKVIIIGDADGDGDIGLKDVVQITRYLAGGWDVTVDLAAADVNKDGEVNLKDAVLLRRYLAGGWGVQLA